MTLPSKEDSSCFVSLSTCLLSSCSLTHQTFTGPCCAPGLAKKAVWCALRDELDTASSGGSFRMAGRRTAEVGTHVERGPGCEGPASEVCAGFLGKVAPELDQGS